MSVEDNRVADEADTQRFLEETVTHACTVISDVTAPPCYRNVIWFPVQPRVTFLIHHQLYVSVCVECVFLCAWACVVICVCAEIPRPKNATRCSDSCSSTSSLQIHPLPSHNICQVNNKPDGSFVFLVTGNEKPTEQSHFTGAHLSNHWWIQNSAIHQGSTSF